MKLSMIVASIHPRASSSISQPNPTFSSFESNTSSQFNKLLPSWNQLKPHTTKHNFPKLGPKWKQYQGINHWEGLLDPLDDSLRSEILRYGHFVEATYKSLDFDPSSLTYATSLYSKKSLLSKCGLEKYGYRLTKYLRVTCGIRVPTWITKTFKQTCTRSSWIGYVAICENKKEITRLGRRDIVIAFRGTVTCLEWLENLRVSLTQLPGLVMGEDDVGPMVQKGFLSLYTSKTTAGASLQEMVRQEIRRVIQRYTNEPLSLTLTGHSLGAALAILSAYDITATFKNAPMVTVISFGGPRVGNEGFKKQLEQKGIRVLRIVNSDDVVTKVPGLMVNLDDGSEDVGVGIWSKWLYKYIEDMELVYVDIGQELRLSSREFPCLNKRDVAMCHDLRTYLHLVKNFVSSSCACKHKKIHSIHS
ncbi:unnamed protein product [Sphenostylis stenocarpa]|uniref:Fungal lipase-type domain-containing protein n=1 Tax=Sphenostylis stenocarpa TaxID=92480 RepID=A0AA86VFA0_9FABA|nr:unnamed protein product [Sphenostylis stenocarpa]